MRFVVNGNLQLLISFRAFHRPHCQLLVLARLLRQHARLPTLRLPECRSLLPQLLAARLAPLSTFRLAACRSPKARLVALGDLGPLRGKAVKGLLEDGPGLPERRVDLPRDRPDHHCRAERPERQRVAAEG